jgi:hypothetical protein
MTGQDRMACSLGAAEPSGAHEVVITTLAPAAHGDCLAAHIRGAAVVVGA